MNGFVKDGACEAVDDPERRRIRGVAPPEPNIRKIDQFLTKLASDYMKVRKLPARRKSISLKHWIPAPTTVNAAKVDSESADPDPPSTA